MDLLSELATLGMSLLNSDFFDLIKLLCSYALYPGSNRNGSLIPILAGEIHDPKHESADVSP